MSRPSKPIPKNSNSKFVTRNSKQDIFTKFTKTSKSKPEADKQTTDSSEPEMDSHNK